jgi:hypothetical protein
MTADWFGVGQDLWRSIALLQRGGMWQQWRENSGVTSQPQVLRLRLSR